MAATSLRPHSLGRECRQPASRAVARLGLEHGDGVAHVLYEVAEGRVQREGAARAVHTYEQIWKLQINYEAF